MNPDCERWVELSDRQALGQALPLDDGEFLRDHARGCRQCGQIAALFGGLRIPDPPDDVPSEREIDSVLLRVGEATRRQSRTQRRLWGGVAAIALAAGLVLWVTARGDDEAGGSRSSEQAQSSGAVATPERAESAAASPPSGEAGCSEAVPGVVVCTAAGTAITERDLDSKDRVLRLGRGHVVVSLVPQPAGTSFSILTEQGRVTAVGTVFSVESSDDGAVTARVVEGKVVVREKDAPAPRPLRAGESLRLGALKPATLTVEERERDLALLPAELRTVPARDSAPPASASAPQPNPEALLQQALALRARGQFQRSADVYRKLYETSPGTAAGGTALVSLGELSLTSLNDPRAALAAFDAYLSMGGALSQEAAFGRIRALRALGRTAEERTAIERFVARYPKVPQSRVLRERLQTLAQ